MAKSRTNNPEQDHKPRHNSRQIHSIELNYLMSILSHNFFPVQDPFKTVKSTQNHRVSVGEQLTLNCDVPEGYPSPRVFWSLAESDEFEIEEDKRVTTDYEGKVTQMQEVPLDARVNMDYHGNCTFIYF